MNLILVYLSVFFTGVKSANILGVFLFPSISHQVVFQPIWRELSLRGHQVTVITPDPLNDPTLRNLTEINVRFTYDVFAPMAQRMSKGQSVSPTELIEASLQVMKMIAEAELNYTEVKKLIADKSKTFDLVLVEPHHPVMFAFGERFEAPVIGVSSLGVLGSTYEILGNPTHPVLYPDMVMNFHNKELSLWQKIKSIYFKLWIRYYRDYRVVPEAQELAKKYFGPDVSNVGDLEKNMSLLFLNVNPLIYPPRPNVPAIVELGQMHIKPVKPLPNDLQKILDDATEGVVYFSLGSIVKSINVPESLRQNIIDALSELPYKVLWKFEADHLPGRPDNVVIRKWFPQQDVLAHKNIKVFVTQGGLQSTEEAISRTVPLIGIPFMGDQPMNVQRIVELGIGLSLHPITLTKEELKNSIIEVAENDKYKIRMQEVHNLLFDKPMTGLEKAVWWSEYVIRHKGASHLRSPTADISWFHYLLLDVLIAVLLTFVASVFVSYKVYKIILSLFSKNKQKLL